jgi:hypothetical protein
MSDPKPVRLDYIGEFSDKMASGWPQKVVMVDHRVRTKLWAGQAGQLDHISDISGAAYEFCSNRIQTGYIFSATQSSVCAARPFLLRAMLTMLCLCNRCSAKNLFVALHMK